ncbi:MAG TPA: PEP-CTERM sorting domain-containing protein [Pirellulales bacterium]|jgi:hypothetical protein
MIRPSVRLLPAAWCALFSLGLVVVLCSTSNGTIIVNDHWTDGTRTDPASPDYADNNGATAIDRDSDGELESAWFINNNGGTNATTVGHITTAPPTGSSNWTTFFAPEATPVTLANAGDQLKVTWEFTPSGVNTSNTSQQFPFCIVDTPSAARLTTDAAPGSGVYTGYAMYTNMGQTLGNSNPFQLKKRSNTGSSTLLNSSGDWGTALANGATSGNHGYDSGTLYTLVWTITRNASNGLDFDVKMSGGTLNGAGFAEVTTTDASPAAYTFDTFNVRPAGSASSATGFDISHFQVEVVPEPTSLMLMGLGVFGLAAMRRRKK